MVFGQHRLPPSSTALQAALCRLTRPSMTKNSLEGLLPRTLQLAAASNNITRVGPLIDMQPEGFL
jgi:hypothetical protein